jgi:4-amino-4-deoxy-L-arabinose transferase-like glycosyltransferase
VFAVALLLRMLVVDIPLERDEGEYAYIAQRWLLGEVPYRDSFDQKPPAVFAVYALILGTLGSSPAAIHWGAQLWTLGTLALVMHLGRAWLSAPAAISAGLLMVLLTVDHALVGNAANTELFALLPLTACMASALRASEKQSWRWSAVAGATGAAAVAFKHVAAPMVILPLLLIASKGKRLPAHLLAFSLGAVAAILPILVYFVGTGAFDALWDALIRFNLSYAAHASVASYQWVLWPQIRATLPSLWLVYLLAVLALLVGWPHGQTVAAPRSRGRLWCTVWLLAGLLAIAAGGYLRRHYFLFAAPPLALLAAAGIDTGLSRLGRFGRLGWLRVAVAAGIVITAVLSSPWYYLSDSAEQKSARIYGNNPFAESLWVGDYLRENSEPWDRIFIFGSEPQLLFYAQRRSASRYMFLYPLMFAFEGVRERQQQALDEIRASQPKFIVGAFLSTSLLEQPDTPRILRHGLRELVESSYRLVAATPFRPDGSVGFAKGEAVRRMWARRPLWETTPPWASLVIWQRDPVGNEG